MRSNRGTGTSSAGIGQAIDQEYLLVGYHSDWLWHTGWLVHEFRDGVSEADQQALLAKMGCSNWVGISALMS